MPAELIQISHSRVESFLLCERKDYYGYHLGLKRKKEGIALGLGNSFHSCVKALYTEILGTGNRSAKQQRQHWDNGVAMMWAEYHRLVAAGWQDEDPRRWPLKTLLENYIRLESLVLAGWRVLAVEKTFHVRWSDESTILFIVDMIAADPGGRQYAIDHKTVWDFFTETEMKLLPQLAKYTGMLRFLGYPIVGGVYNQIRSRKLNGGKMLKAEMLEAVRSGISDAARVTHTTEYGKVIDKWSVAQLQEVADAFHIATETPAEDEKLYRLSPVTLSDTRVKRALEEQFMAAERLLERTALTTEQYEQTALRTPSKMVCKMCSFKEICPAELNGEDTRLIMETFDHRDPRELPELDGEEDDES